MESMRGCEKGNWNINSNEFRSSISSLFQSGILQRVGNANFNMAPTVAPTAVSFEPRAMSGSSASSTSSASSVNMVPNTPNSVNNALNWTDLKLSGFTLNGSSSPSSACPPVSNGNMFFAANGSSALPYQPVNGERTNAILSGPDTLKRDVNFSTAHETGILNGKSNVLLSDSSLPLHDVNEHNNMSAELTESFQFLSKAIQQTGLLDPNSSFNLLNLSTLGNSCNMADESLLKSTPTIANGGNNTAATTQPFYNQHTAYRSNSKPSAFINSNPTYKHDGSLLHGDSEEEDTTNWDSLL